jgi:hypothetical protein
MMLKYKNKPVAYSLSKESRVAKHLAEVTFASELEFATFCILKSFVPLECIHIHKPIWLIGKITWSIDFMVMPTNEYPNVPILLIESKGIADDVFKLKVELLKNIIPDAYQRLFLVVSEFSKNPVAPECELKVLKDYLKTRLKIADLYPHSTLLKARLLERKPRELKLNE